MKKLIIIATVAITACTAVNSFAGSCRIAPGHGYHPPVCPPQPICHVKPYEPVYRPAPICHIAPPPPICPPVHKCRITACLPEPVRCVVRPVEPCHKCHSHVCHCHREVPVCRIQPCEIVHPVCRIKPCEHIDPGYPLPPEPPAELPQVESGHEVTIDGQQFGFQPGRVVVQFGELLLEAHVTGWTNTEVRAVLPALPLTNSTPALVAVIAADGQVADQLDVAMLPQTQQLARR